MDCLLFIHGFGSCGRGQKSIALEAHFGSQRVLMPDISPEPNLALGQLEQLIQQHRPSLLVGSSLGGFYADTLNGRHDIPSVLINPSTEPHLTLDAHIGPQKRWCDGVAFDWRQQDVDALSALYRAAPQAQERYLVLVQTEDEVLDYRLAAARYKDKERIIEKGGNHRFENFPDYLERIEDFWLKTSRKH